MSSLSRVIVINQPGHQMSPKLQLGWRKCRTPVDSKLYYHFCTARDCFMILMIRNFQFNTLSRGNQRHNLLYKKACRGIFGGFILHQSLPETLPVATGNEISLTTICIYIYIYIYIYILLIVHLSGSSKTIC